MLWVVWRQYRAALLTAIILLGLVAVPVILGGLAMHADFRSSGAAACAADPASSAECKRIVGLFTNQYIDWANRLVWITAVPALAGVFVGAPMLAREFEQGTWRLAFTQSVTRTRWLVTNLATVGAGLAVVAFAFSALFTWWRGPLDLVGSRMRTASFIVTAPSLVAVTIFAFAVGVLAGALLRRTIAAMGATLVAYLVVRIPVEESVRPTYLTPLSRTTDPAAQSAAGWRPSTDWVVDSGWIDAAGRHLSQAEENAIARYADSDESLTKYLVEHNLRIYTEYHPSTSLPAMQLVEAAIFLGSAGVLLALAVWLIRRRTA